jgi:hypothetical protein
MDKSRRKLRSQSTYHIDATISRNGDNRVQRSQINANNRHVYGVSAAWRGSCAVGEVEIIVKRDTGGCLVVEGAHRRVVRRL